MIRFSLPMPPSVNSIYQVGVKGFGRGKRNVYLDPKYRDWLDDAKLAWLRMPPTKRQRISGPFVALVIWDDRKRGLSDVDNRIKALLDGLKQIGITDDDRKADGVLAFWGRADGCDVRLVGSENLTAGIVSAYLADASCVRNLTQNRAEL